MWTPEWTVAPAPEAWDSSDAERLLADEAWAGLAPLEPPLSLSDGSGAPRFATETRVAATGGTLYVRFVCDDADIWGSMTRRGDPIYEEEAVEVFLAPGAEPPLDYFEFEVSPHGVLFDATIHNPTGDRREMTGDAAWNCPGIRWAAGCDRAASQWRAVLAIPLAPLAAPGSGAPLSPVWRANFYRIERPRDGSPHEFAAWSPTRATPPDFHRPALFGLLRLPF